MICLVMTELQNQDKSLLLIYNLYSLYLSQSASDTFTLATRPKCLCIVLSTKQTRSFHSREKVYVFLHHLICLPLEREREKERVCVPKEWLSCFVFISFKPTEVG